MVVADENIDHNIIFFLRKIGIEVFSIYETNRGFTDLEIIEFSKNPASIILTEDKDFGEWVFAHHEKNISVILLRYKFNETELIIDILKEVFLKRKTELFGKFTTISVNKIRIREI